MSYTLSLSSFAPNFRLKATDGRYYTLSDFSKSKALVIFFTCNHCPYVIGSNENTKEIAEKFIPRGVNFVAINSNSSNTYPEDSYDHMIKEMQEKQYPWAYLHDETQNVARQYGALKTPHFFIFDEERKLVYTGRAIDTPRDYRTAQTSELVDALNELLMGKKITKPITNPIGCNIKWDGKPAHWMPPQACDLVTND